MSFRSVELCAGAGGQALGLHLAGFSHVALAELDSDSCRTLRRNGERLGWSASIVHEADIRRWRAPDECFGADLLAAGVPCPPFSIAGRQLGQDDERDLFPALIQLAEVLRPRAVQAENVRGLMSMRFDGYRTLIERRLSELGYVTSWKLLQASDFGVPQLRPRTLMVALRAEDAKNFSWPIGSGCAPTVGQVLKQTMSARGWDRVDEWAEAASGIAPTLVGGSRKHGGPDLGPTRARQAWAQLGVNGIGIADEVPTAGFRGMPKLTVRQAALLQGFPEWWEIEGRKTSAYRQIGNAFPPPVAQAVGEQIKRAFESSNLAAEPKKDDGLLVTSVA